MKGGQERKGREEREGHKGGIMEDRRGEERRAKSLISSGIDHGAHTPINTHREGFLLQPLSLRLTPITCTNTVDQQRGLAPHTGLRGGEQQDCSQSQVIRESFGAKSDTNIIVSIKVSSPTFYTCAGDFFPVI